MDFGSMMIKRKWKADQMNHLKKVINFIHPIIVTLRFSILSIFISLFVTASIILMAINYKNASHDIFFTANKSMHDITQSLNQLFISEISRIERDAHTTAALISRKVLDVNHVNTMTNYLFTAAEHFNITQEIYWGDTKGNYLSAVYNNDDTITSYYADASKVPPLETALYRNIQGNIIATTTSSSHYDPRQRPWYQAALAKGKPTWTEVYLFQPFEYLGITLGTPVYENTQLIGVLGVDIRLDWISWYIDSLTTTPHGILFVVQEDGKLIGYPQFEKLPKQTHLIDIHTLPAKWIADSFDLYKKSKNRSFFFCLRRANLPGKISACAYRHKPKMVNWSGNS